MPARLLSIATVLALGCAVQPAGSHHQPDPARGIVPLQDDSPLVAVLTPVGDSRVAGVFHFYRDPEGTRVVGVVTGLVPQSRHGFHVHAFGDASDAAKADSAGVHFNPKGHDHALPPATERHAGSFPNLQADETGTARFDFIDETITLTRGETAVLGRSIIVHEKEDVGAQPWGGAGGRIAIGVIGLANPQFTPPVPQR
jgi:Cu-Zn family superoxide dismutase